MIFGKKIIGAQISILMILLLIVTTTALLASCGNEHGGRGEYSDDPDNQPNNDDDDDDDNDTGDDDTGDDDDEPDGVREINQSECLSTNKVTGWTENLLLTWDGNELVLEHQNSCRNCGFELQVIVMVAENTITLTEYNDPEDDPANCECLFDFSYILTDIDPGSYSFILLADDFGQGWTQTYEYDIDLPAESPVSYELPNEHEGMCI